MYFDPDREIGRPALVGTPGLEQFCKPVANREVRGMYVRGSTLYAVCGNTVYSIDTSGNATSLGTIGTSTGKVWFAYDDVGTAELMIVDGSAAYRYTGGSLSSQGVNCTPSSLAYLNLYFFVSASGSDSMYASGAGDGSTWGALITAQAEGDSDPIMALMSVNKDMWVLGSKSTEIWRWIGGSTFPVQPIGGGYQHVGCAAAGSACELDNSAFWLNDRFEVVRTMGTQVQVVSTQQLSAKFSDYATNYGVSDARGYAMYWRGHAWYVLTFPSANATWVYDASLVAPQTGLEAWFQWSSGLAGGRHRGVCGALFNGDWLVGDYENGRIYRLDKDKYTDDGEFIKSVRTAQAVRSDRKKIFHYSLEIEMGEGVGTVSANGLSTLSASASTGAASIAVTSATDIKQNYHIGVTLTSGTVQWFECAQKVGSTVYLSDTLDGAAASGNQVEWYNNLGEDPQAMLRWSDDRGKTWSNEKWAGVGKAGEYQNRIIYRKLGSAIDRTYEWSMTDPVKRVIYGANLNAKVGTG